MAKKIILEFTQAQFNAMVNLRDDCETQTGGTDVDVYMNKQVRLIDRMLKANRYYK